MNSWSALIKPGLSAPECQQITAHALAHLPEEPGKVGGHSNTPALQHSMRKSRIRWLKRDNPVFDTLFAKTDFWLSKANAEVFDLRVTGVPYECQFSEYRAEDGAHYDWHEDNAWLGAGGSDRKLSLVIELSDAATYTGGRLELARDNPTANQYGQQGDAIIFPSHLRHRANPVTSGIRYSLAIWWRGPRLS